MSKFSAYGDFYTNACGYGDGTEWSDGSGAGWGDGAGKGLGEYSLS